MTPELAEIERWVRAELAAGRQTGAVDIAEVAAHPTCELVACTLTVRPEIDAEETTQVALVDVDTGRCDVVDLDAKASRAARWSPDGKRLAVLVTGDDSAPTASIADVTGGSAADLQITHRLTDIDGAVEDIAWSPDGARLAVIVAQFGAEISDVYGSGTVEGPTSAESWRPVVSPALDSGRRTLHIWSPATGEVDQVSPELNVWEATWSGDDRLIVLASEGAGEGAWYAATLHQIGLDGTSTPLHTAGVQMAAPRSTRTGERWSVIVGRASDRGLLAGDLYVATGADAPRKLDTADVDVTAHYWLDEQRICFAGTRRLDTVFGVLNIELDTVEELFATDGASGRYQAEAPGLTANQRLVTVLERHDQPPTLSAVKGGSTHDLLSTAGPGTAHVIAHAGQTSQCSWTSKDGSTIEGLLTVPQGDGPHPLVVIVHGGPVATTRDEWIAKDPHAAILATRGFAVLRPNPRGSAGRGQDFIEAVVADMGGADVDDILTGVAAMVDRGITEPGRIGISGNSYGGYMAAWIPCWSDVFAAAVSRSPVTDWQSQHLTGNLAEFDEVFVGGDPFDPQSPYTTRSPLTYHRQNTTPTLFTAGANDLATPASQAQQMHRALLRNGVPTQLAVYPEEGHGVRRPDALADQLARMVWWFEHYLTAGQSPGGQA